MITPIIPLTVLMSCLPALAQGQRPEGEAPDGPPPHPPCPIMEVLDSDQDHHLSADEIAKASTALAGLDENKDGSIELKELAPPHPQEDEDHAEEGPPPPSALFASIDENRDGSLSEDETNAAPKSLAKLDRNGDGEIDEREMRPKPPEKGDANSTETGDEPPAINPPFPGHGRPPGPPRGPRH